MIALPSLFRRCLPGVLACASLLPISLKAETLLFHATYLSPSPGSQWVDNNGQTWNYIPTWLTWPSTPRVYQNSDGIASAVQWTTTKRFAYYSGAGPGSSALGYPDLVAKNGLYLASSGSPGAVSSEAQVTLSGLDPELAYHLTFYGSGAGTADARITLSINGVNVGHLDVPNGTREAELEVFALKANPSGVMVIDFILPTTHASGRFNALKIEAIPEPGTLGMLGVGVLVPLYLLRRNR